VSRVINQEVQTNQWDQIIKIPHSILGELEWWRSKISENKPYSQSLQGAAAILTTVASYDGYGGIIQIDGMKKMISTGGNWQNQEQRQIKEEITRFKVKNVLIQTDNSTTAYSLNRRRASKSLSQITETVLRTAEEQNFKIKTTHIPGKMNSEADALSGLARSGDYCIKQQILNLTLEEWKIKPTIDAFANRWNMKVKRFFSINKDLCTDGRDALIQN
ncbi:MAG: hypothetical protein EZS28_035398, partial [Streblomastix strix]